MVRKPNPRYGRDYQGQDKSEGGLNQQSQTRGVPDPLKYLKEALLKGANARKQPLEVTLETLEEQGHTLEALESRGHREWIMEEDDIDHWTRHAYARDQWTTPEDPQPTDPVTYWEERELSGRGPAVLTSDIHEEKWQDGEGKVVFIFNRVANPLGHRDWDKKHHPLRSAWTDRAMLEMERTGARAAVSDSGWFKKFPPHEKSTIVVP